MLGSIAVIEQASQKGNGDGSEGEGKANLAQALAYWERLRRGRPTPARADIDPAAIPHLLPNVVLVDVLDAPADFRFRLVGTAVWGHNRSDFTGRRFSELWPDRAASRMWGDYGAVVRDRRPLCTDIPYAGPNKEIRAARHALMPLSRDGRAVDMIFGLVTFAPLTGG